MKKNLIFIIFFSTILFFIATFGILSTVFAQTSTNVCRYNIETKEDPICISRTACRMVVDDCQGEWGCITPFGCSAPKPTCANTENCSRWSPVNEQRSSTSLDRERAEELENILENAERVPHPPHPYPECMLATSTPMPAHCFFSDVVRQQIELWTQIRDGINAYNSALYMYEIAVKNWRANAYGERPGPRPIPPDPNDFIVKENNSLSDIFSKSDRVRYESSYGSDPRALTPPVSKDEAFKIFNDAYQRLFNEIAARRGSYSYEQRPPTGQRPPQQYNPPTGQRPSQQYNNPFDVSYFRPTTIPGVTDRNQSNQAQQNQSQSQNNNVSNTNNAINSLSDIMSKINSVLEGVNNLSKEEKDVITKAIQSILDIIKDLIVNLTKRTITPTQKISFLANGQTNLTVYSGDIINYTWRGPSGTGYTYSSDYTIDKEDNCGWGIKPGEKKPWYANTQQGSTSAVVQQCQADRTYTITYMAKDSTGTPIVSTSITVRVLNNQSQINNRNKIGVYFWGGDLRLSSNYLQDGINLAKRIGAKIIRITISSKDMPLYKLSNQCSSDSLVQMAKNFENLFKDSQFDTIIITAYDQIGLSCSAKKYLDPSFYTSENIQRMKQEYKDLANYLGQNFPNKKFIIANWESDNDIYCGTAYGFNPSTNQCDYRNGIEAFKKFISVRGTAIRESNQSNVFSGVEFNIVNYLKDNNLPSTLYDVIPYVPADYYLYSAYESINNLYKDNGVNLLNLDISKIKQVLSNSGKNQNNLIIGEYGFGSGDREQNKNLLSKATETFLNDSSIQYAIIWNLLDVGGNFGLFDERMNFTSQGNYIREVLEVR